MAKRAGVNKHGFRMMPSWQAGECAWCGKRWAKGKVIWWHVRWKIAVCTPSHGEALVRVAPPTYASKRRANMAPSPPMEERSS